MEMRVVDVLNNIKGHDYDIGGYHLCLAESTQVIAALEKQIPYKLKYINHKWMCECGNEINGKTKYCSNCGRKVKYD